MKRNNASIKTYVLSLFVTAGIVAGCNSLTGPPANGTSSGENAYTSAMHRLAVATTTFKFFVTPPIYGNNYGTYTPEPCWTVSPSPLPKYITQKISVSYHSAGCSKRSIVIEYVSGYGSQAQPCYYTIKYPVSGPFSYSTYDQYFVQCNVATAPPGKAYDEQLIYGPVGTAPPNSPKRRR